MGLDIVEFILGVEEALSVTIPNAAAREIQTPRMLVNFISSQLPQSRVTHCLSQRAFYRLRKTLSHQLGHDPAALRPGTKILPILPTGHPQAAWATAGDSLGCTDWPSPRGGGWLAGTFLQTRPQTLGDAARHMVTFSPGILKPVGEGWSWHEVASVVDGQMRYHFAIQEYSPDDRFIQDLGLC